MGVLLQVIDKSGKTKVLYYRLVEIGTDETAEGLVAALERDAKEDGLWPILEQRLRGVSSDGASVMKGK